MRNTRHPHSLKTDRSQDRERGAIAIAFIAVALPVILGALILAVDLGYARIVKLELQRTADSAAVAGLRAMTQTPAADEELIYQSAATIAARNQANGRPVSLVAAPGNAAANRDVVVGRLDDIGRYGSKFTPTTGTDANAVKVTARMLNSRGTGVRSFFGAALGRPGTDVSAEAIAAMGGISATELVPMALAVPGFAPVDPDQPAKPGPSQPANGTHFEIGETVTLFFFGTGSGGPVHLVLDTQRAGHSSDPSKVFKAEERGPVLSIGDQLYVEGEGTGGGGYGGDMENRIDDYPTDHAMREVIVPIVKELPSSRNGNGELTGQIELVDFAAVHLDRVRRYKVRDPKDNQQIEVQALEGTIIRKLSESRSLASPSAVMPTPSLFGMRLAY